MTVRDALHETVRGYPGGAEALATRMTPPVAATTLRSMANPAVESHDWPLKRFEQVLALTGDMRPLDALCADFNGVFVPLGHLPEGEEEVSLLLADLGKDFGGVCASLQEALADGRVTKRELRNFEGEVYKLNQAAQALKALVEKKAAQHPLNGPKA